MANWIQVATISDLPPGTSAETVAGDRLVAIFNVEGHLFALDGVCPHQGGPLGQGALSGCLVTCPWHGWQFNVKTGQHQTSNSLRHPSFPVRVEGEAIFVDVE